MSSKQVTFNSNKALSYLRSQFDEAMQLCFESPLSQSYRGTFWTMNDNALAVQALLRLGDKATADTIAQKLDTITLPFAHNAFSNNGWADTFIHKDTITPSPFHGTRCYRILDSKLVGPYPCDGGGGGLWHEEANGGEMLDEEDYFLLGASKALNYHKKQDFANRDRLIRHIENFWDDIGNRGFRDKVDSSEAELKNTMKLAAYLLLSEKCGRPNVFSSTIVKGTKELMNSLQLRNGGFATQYFASKGQILWQRTDTFGNTETASLCMMANINPADYL